MKIKNKQIYNSINKDKSSTVFIIIPNGPTLSLSKEFTQNPSYWNQQQCSDKADPSSCYAPLIHFSLSDELGDC